MNDIHISQEMLISKISKLSNVDYKTVKLVFDTCESILINDIRKVTENLSLSFKIFSGISIDAKWKPSKNQLNNLTHEKIVSESKIMIKANITKCYKRKINEKKGEIENAKH